jgi:hypothetical protein
VNIDDYILIDARSSRDRRSAVQPGSSKATVTAIPEPIFPQD